MHKEEMMVAAIQNGTVLDHIPPCRLFKVASMLGLENLSESITIGNNLKSKRCGLKGVIKVSNKYFSDEELGRIALLAPSIHLNIIRDYNVIEKRTIELPEEVEGLIRCPNPKCITNNEPMYSRFKVIDRDNEIFRCHYCGRKLKQDQIELL
ncbi:aspartate carbamoyltransferase [Porphyromonas macacae]|uniref:Aspartate carbamoyltransferase regulatory chain n=1 Tax=Porphyromonas macacae TaxID=28115 RepID=A0A379DK59_9PORP|nr:aspartate carbamoyltransferase regulatory subunit [Porphyromonas macacae]KGO00542.1 aspartate carbamoyltransferase [Porphyromonas macacae]SUB78324.1 Aspartate carbamoyltransferase regulatory chain [Porphyromonas macacae]